jgi:membrane protease YdiL (CAAX protease family)
VCFYVATLLALIWFRFPLVHWVGLASVVSATALTVAIWDRGRWALGFFVPPGLALRELAAGSAWGFGLVASCAALVVLSTETTHAPGNGFPWLELLAVYVPAAVHEELLFRGYPFQKLFAWSKLFAIFAGAFVFAALHSSNTSVTLLGLVNVFLGGILLGVAYQRHLRLWFPIGLHLAWNITSGPILGHEVSGYAPLESVLVEIGSGPAWLSGGEFGIEGSVLMTLVEATGIALLARRKSTG